MSKSIDEHRLEREAMTIVHLVGQMMHEEVPDNGTSKAMVDIRQATNDKAIDAVIDLIAQAEKEAVSKHNDALDDISDWAARGLSGNGVDAPYRCLQMISDRLHQLRIEES